jgi:hypothetical protein
VAYLIEYLGKFEFIFETVLGYISGDQMGSFEAKKESKISRLGTFKVGRVLLCAFGWQIVNNFLFSVSIIPVEPPGHILKGQKKGRVIFHQLTPPGALILT